MFPCSSFNKFDITEPCNCQGGMPFKKKEKKLKKIAVEFILFPKMFCSSYFFLLEKRSQMIKNTKPNLVYISARFYSSCMAAAAAGIRH